MKNYTKTILMCGCAFLCLSAAHGQKSIWSYLGRSHDQRDSNYIRTYEGDIIGRIYYTGDNTGVTTNAPGAESFDYKPNNSKGTGIGVSYRDISLNLSFKLLGVPKEKGKTKSLTLGTSLYKEQWVYDLALQHFKGMYLNPKSGHDQDDPYYLRPDLKSTFVSGDFWRVMNSDRFSYRGVMSQTEWQKKSAGSLLLGGAMSFGAASGDSALVPSALAARFPQRDVEKMHFFRLGAGIGYAYTFIFKKHFFVSGDLTANMDWTSTREFTDETDRTKNAFTPHVNYRFSVGYNDRRMIINAAMVNNSVSAKGAFSPDSYRLFARQFRITIARRFTPGSKAKKTYMKPVDKQIDRAKDKVDSIKGDLRLKRRKSR